MQRSEVYDLRISRRSKSELEEVARAQETSVGNLLETIVREWLDRSKPTAESEEETQRRLREAAAPFIGSIRGGGRARSETVRTEVRSRLARKHGR